MGTVYGSRDKPSSVVLVGPRVRLIITVRKVTIVCPRTPKRSLISHGTVTVEVVPGVETGPFTTLDGRLRGGVNVRDNGLPLPLSTVSLGIDNTIGITEVSDTGVTGDGSRLFS